MSTLRMKRLIGISILPSTMKPRPHMDGALLCVKNVDEK